MRVEHLVVAPDAVPGEEEPAVPRRTEDLPLDRPPEPDVAPAPGPAGDGLVAPDGAGRVASAAERLAPRMGDRRLWRPPAGVRSSPSIIAGGILATRSGIAGRIVELNDSLEWTVAGEDGGAWGASAGKVHLGSWTSPGEMRIGSPEWVRKPGDEWDRARMEQELADQIARALAAESIADRIKAIRERKDRERAKRKKSGSGG